MIFRGLGSGIQVLRRRFSDSLDDARVGDGRNGFLDSLHLDLVEPVVAKVEPVAEGMLAFLQIQVVQRCRAGIAVIRLPFI